MAIQVRQQPHKKIVLGLGMPCPCRSGKTIGDCHYDSLDGRLRKPRPNLRPPGPKTGYLHPGCYLRETGDCSEQISKEHYISRSVLQQLGKVLRISGVPWLPPEQTLDTTIQNLTAKILCRRHNEALSPLDTEAGTFFSSLTEALLDLNRSTLSRRPIFHLVGGETMELWMLKVACGIYYSIGSKDGKKIAETHAIDFTRVRSAFFNGQWDTRGGLYFRGNPGTVISVAHNLGVGPLTMDHSGRFGGVAVSLNGFTLELVFDTRDTNEGQWTALVHRPTEFVLTKRGREHHIVLTWPPGTPEASIRLDERNSPGRRPIEQANADLSDLPQ